MLFKSKRMAGIVMVVILLSCVVCPALQAQELRKGDIVPKTIRSLVSYPGKKLVIVQFWNTICGACVHSLPKIDSLQRLYEKDVQFVMVTSQPKETVDEFFLVRQKILKPQGAKYFYSDTLLKKYFPYAFVPHHVWISEAGKVVAITSGANTDAASIRNYLATKTTSLPGIKKRVDHDWKIPVLSTHYGLDNKNSYHSYLLPAIDSFGAEHAWKKGGGSKEYNRIIINGRPMAELFMDAYNEGRDRFSASYSNVEVRYKTALYRDTSLYLYDLQVPEARGALLYKYMREDLERVFSFRASIERKKLKCLILKASSDSALALTKGGTSTTIAPKKKGDSLFIFRNISMSSFAYILNRYTRPSGYELKDETGIHSNVDLSIYGEIIDVLNINQLRKALASYGILLEEGYCEAEVLVLSEQ